MDPNATDPAAPADVEAAFAAGTSGEPSAWGSDTLSLDVPDTERFVVDDLAKATWAVRKIAERRRALAEVEAVAHDERTRIDTWVEDERQRCRRDTEHLEQLLAAYHRDRLVDDPKAKTIRTPHGELVARKAPDRVEVDPDVFVPWAERNAEHLLAPPAPRRPAKAAIKKNVGDIMSDGQVVNADTGEFIPGVTWVDGETTYKTVTPEDDR